MGLGLPVRSVEAVGDSLTLLVEVDRRGDIVRASGPEGWTYSAEADRRLA